MITLSEKKKKSMIGKWVEKHKAPVICPGCDEVSIQYVGGGGNGCCRITKITDTGFHYSTGGIRRDKSVQLKDIVEIWKRKQNDEGAEK